MAKGRPRTFDRDEALDRATMEFWRHGYEATSIAGLTGAMGINPPSLYAAFGDKKALFEEAVLAYGARPEGAFMGVALAEEPTAYGAFARILREAAHHYADPSHPAGCLTICAATNVAAASAEVGEFLRGIRNANLGVFDARLRAARDAGELPAGTDTMLLANYFAAVIQGMSQRSRDGADERELAGVAELAMAGWPGSGGRG